MFSYKVQKFVTLGKISKNFIICLAVTDFPSLRDTRDLSRKTVRDRRTSVGARLSLLLFRCGVEYTRVQRFPETELFVSKTVHRL